MNIFLNNDIANKYDAYYQTPFGKQIDEIEKRIISQLIKNIPRKNMLELGCGTGHWTEFFINQGFEVTATDISEAMLQLAEAKNLRAKFSLADSENLPFETNSYDCVSSITMLEFVDNQDEVFEEIKRVLKPNGWLVLGCLNENSILAQNKENDETFRDAKFLTKEKLSKHLTIFGTPTFDYGIYLAPSFEILDNTQEKDKAEPVFMAVVVQKKNHDCKHRNKLLPFKLFH